MPLLILPINTSFLGTLSLPCHPSFPKLISLAAALLKNPRTPAKSSPTVSQVSDLLLLREAMAVNFIVPEVNLSHLSSFCRTSLLFTSLLT